MKVLLLDNYDSFTYNLFHYLEGKGCDVDVIKNDEISLDDLPNYDKIVLSPGPGLPSSSGKLMDVIKTASPIIPVLGVCLGFQAIVEYFGGTLVNQKEVKHGVSTSCHIENQGRLLKGIESGFQVGLYHSWGCREVDIPETLKVLAKTDYEVIMTVEHEALPVAGIQFHPESVLTDFGHEVIENFLQNF
ncbi:MAG: aminodeoxychorismate/anthranilate synthase component II [Crocinitomicaceae bacterium]|nr:aminodeoxychorismate/anthranilate synthase component II [Crocinitomicaceae bacterium]